MRKQHENAIAAGKQAVLLNPNGADAYCQLAYALHQSGRPVEAIEFLKKAIRLNPIPPSTYFHTLGHAYWTMERYEEALEAYEKAALLEPANVFAHIGLTATYSIMGREEEARAAAIEVLRINPEFSPSDIEKTSPNKNRASIKRYAEALRRAGLK